MAVLEDDKTYDDIISEVKCIAHYHHRKILFASLPVWRIAGNLDRQF
jgi:hypothetical protein